MKNLFLGAICLCLFAISFSLVQISCSKTEAQNSNTQINSINKVLVSQSLASGQFSFTIMNYDGSGVQVLNIPFPAGFNAASSLANTALSADGKKIFFTGRDSNADKCIYCISVAA